MKLEDFKKATSTEAEGAKRKYITATGILPLVDAFLDGEEINMTEDELKALVERNYTMCDGYLASEESNEVEDNLVGTLE